MWNVINNDVFLHAFGCFSLRSALWLQVCTVCYSVNSLDLAGEFKMQLEWKKVQEDGFPSWQGIATDFVKSWFVSCNTLVSVHAFEKHTAVIYLIMMSDIC